MRTLNDFITTYNRIANRLGYTGSSVEVLVQLLANASYIEELEDMSYVQEASLERATLTNSKIQHCVDRMYSVFRGSCPRVILKIQPSRYLSYKLYDKILSGNRFNIYYTGYYKCNTAIKINETNTNNNFTNIIDTNNGTTDTTEFPEEYVITNFLQNLDTLEDTWINEEPGEGYHQVYSDLGFEFVHSDLPLISPDEKGEASYIIEGLIASSTTKGSETTDSTNGYYVSPVGENLSNDVLVNINSQAVGVTRNFADHILHGKVFDLTIPDFGSRLYIANNLREGRDSNTIQGAIANTVVDWTYFNYSELSDYNKSDLERLNIQEVNLTDFNESWLKEKNYNLDYADFGISYISEVSRDNLNTVHYKANRDRYVNSIFRTNSDIGTVLEEEFPNKVRTGGTNYVFSTLPNDSNSSLVIYYIPKSESYILSGSEISNFIKEKRAYYITTKDIEIRKGKRLKAEFNIDVNLYDSSISVGEEINSLLKDNYEYKFDVIFNDSTLQNIRALISKVSNVKKISSLSIKLSDPEKNNSPIEIDNSGKIVKGNISSTYSTPNSYYFEISTNIITTVS